MNTKICFGIAGMAIVFALIGRADNPRADVSSNAPEIKNLSEVKWDKILPDLGENSPEICILRIDPKTHATSLLISTPKAIHIRKHWHTANETHTIIKGTATFACNGKKFTFITVDGAWDVNWVEGQPTAADLIK